MWFLATRGRPDQCIGLIEAMQKTGDVPEVAVMIDDNPKKYAGVPWPSHWHIHVAPQHLEMTKAINTLLNLHPGHSCYGMFGDHFRPLTPMFKQLKEACGDWFMAWPSDAGTKTAMAHVQPAGAPTFGAKLIEAWGGWICLPTTIHVATERPWWQTWKDIGNVRVVADTCFDRTWPNKPGSIRRKYQGRDYNLDDSKAWNEWLRQHAPRVMSQIRAKMAADGLEFDHHGRIAAKYGCAPFILGGY